MIDLSKPLTATFRHISSADPAVDKDHPDYDQELYGESWDTRHIPIREGSLPTVFQCVPLSRLAFRQIQQRMDSGQQAEAMQDAIAYSLRGIENGGDLVLKFVRTDAGRKLHRTSLDLICAPQHTSIWTELALRIIRSSTLSPLSEPESDSAPG
jgi:hypothetical protein